MKSRFARSRRGGEVDQCNSELWVFLAPQMRRRFNQDHFERRPHKSFEKMAAAGRLIEDAAGG
jgi:hypothetical protein